MPDETPAPLPPVVALEPQPPSSQQLSIPSIPPPVLTPPTQSSLPQNPAIPPGPIPNTEPDNQQRFNDEQPPPYSREEGQYGVKPPETLPSYAQANQPRGFFSQLNIRGGRVGDFNLQGRRRRRVLLCGSPCKVFCWVFWVVAVIVVICLLGVHYAGDKIGDMSSVDGPNAHIPGAIDEVPQSLDDWPKLPEGTFLFTANLDKEDSNSTCVTNSYLWNCAHFSPAPGAPATFLWSITRNVSGMSNDLPYQSPYIISSAPTTNLSISSSSTLKFSNAITEINHYTLSDEYYEFFVLEDKTTYTYNVSTLTQRNVGKSVSQNASISDQSLRSSFPANAANITRCSWGNTGFRVRIYTERLENKTLVERNPDSGYLDGKLWLGSVRIKEFRRIYAGFNTEDSFKTDYYNSTFCRTVNFKSGLAEQWNIRSADYVGEYATLDGGLEGVQGVNYEQCLCTWGKEVAESVETIDSVQLGATFGDPSDYDPETGSVDDSSN